MSKKAHNGSAASSPSSQQHATSHAHMHANSEISREQLVERYIRDERDHRSLAVEQYDQCQEEAKRGKVERLKEIVGERY